MFLTIKTRLALYPAVKSVVKCFEFTEKALKEGWLLSLNSGFQLNSGNIAAKNKNRLENLKISFQHCRNFGINDNFKIIIYWNFLFLWFILRNWYYQFLKMIIFLKEHFLIFNFNWNFIDIYCKKWTLWIFICILWKMSFQILSVWASYRMYIS